jgi:hypothetical protein
MWASVAFSGSFLARVRRAPESHAWRMTSERVLGRE